MKNLLIFASALILLATPGALFSQEDQIILDEKSLMKLLDSIEHSFQWQTGKVDLPNGMATINLPANLRYLNADQSKMVLTDIWGNPPSLSSLGMLFPVGLSPLSDSAWAFNINYDDLGYVKDSDADEIDYNELLANMQKEAADASKERVEQGYESIEIVGWASSPFYDKEKKVLHWSKEIKFGDGATSNTINYDVRFLGRNGVLSLNAIGQMEQLELIKGTLPSVTSAVAFTNGNRYEDFDSKVDDVAAWTLGGLVAGKVLAKAGFFAIILKFIKPLILLLGAGGAAAYKFFSGRKKKEDEEV